MRRRVLVTRPEPGASVTAARLARMGFEPVILPLTRIVPIAQPLQQDVACDAVAVTSVNAVRHAPHELLAALEGRPVFAVGDASAAAAREGGFRAVQSAAGTAVDLVELIGGALPHGARILHLAGSERTEGFAEGLAAKGFAIEVLEIYSADRIFYSADFLSRTLGPGALWGALALSQRAGTFLADIAALPQLGNVFGDTTFFCISEKVAGPLRAVSAGTIAVSSEPTEEGVLRLLSPQG